MTKLRIFSLCIRALALASFASFFCLSGAFSSAFAANPPQVSGRVHLQDIGDKPLANNQWAGTKGESRRIEAFWLQVDHTDAAVLSVKYMCHLENTGDTVWKLAGTLCGTRGESRRLEGFAIKLTGSSAQFFTIKYQCHIENSGDSAVMADGQFCGTRNQSLRVESMKVWIDYK